MKRSAINSVYKEALAAMQAAHWALPPNPRWDITDFGLGDFDRYGLTLINLAEEPEYCEKIMYARAGQITPAHTHHVKKEDIIVRQGQLALRLWDTAPEQATQDASFRVNINGVPSEVYTGSTVVLEAGERITLTPGIYHEFWAEAAPALIGEVSTANDDATDNIFANPDIGRFPGIEEDDPPLVILISEDA